MANYFEQKYPREEAEMAAAASSGNYFEQKYPREAAEAPSEEGQDIWGDGSISAGLEQAFGPAEEASYDPASQAQTAVSDSVEWASDRVVDMAFTAYNKFVPDDWKEGIADYSERAWTSIASNPTIGEGIEMAKDSLESYREWAKENPEASRRLEEVINISAVARPRGMLPDKYKGLEVRATKELAKNRRASVGKMMEPIGKKGEGNLVMKGSTRTYVPSKWEKLVQDEVVTVKGVNPKKPYTHNMNAVRDKSKSYKDELDTLVAKSQKPVNTQAIKTGLANRVNNLQKETLLSGDAYEKAVRLYRKSEELIDASDGTAAGILQARRDLDRWVNNQRSVFDSNFESATTVALREIRNHMNDAVKKEVRDPKVGKLLDKQSKLLYAGDELYKKASNEADGAVGRMIQKLEGGTGEKLPTTPLAQAATATYAVTKGAVIAPVVATVGAYKGLRWLGTARGKVWLAEMAQNPLLTVETNALIQLAQGLEPEEGEE